VACACRISGELRSQLAAVDVIGPTGPGVTAGEFDELIDAFAAGVTYVNVHTTKYPGGEIRAQLVNGNH
jgi:CHRD domain